MWIDDRSSLLHHGALRGRRSLYRQCDSAHPPPTPGKTCNKRFGYTRVWSYDRRLFSYPTTPTKLNPITAMKQLFKTMIKDKPSLVLRSPCNDKQIVLATASLPSGETEFNKFFKVSTTHNKKHNKTHVFIGCNVLSNRTLSQIKFCSTDSHLLDWLKKEHVFVELDSLGIEHPITVGYFF